jgi:uncharacterized membrane protein
MSRCLIALSLLVAACGSPGESPPDARIINGCPSLVEAQAESGDPIDGDTWDTYAAEFFETWCTRCHSVDNVTPDERTNAPDGYNWDDEASVLEHISEIRNAVGVFNFMPFNPPDPSCDDRQRIVRWIDAGHPGL